MKKYVATYLFMLLVFSSSGQSIFQQISFEEALSKAAKDHKLILVNLLSRNCNQCNDVAAKGMNSQILFDRIMQDSIIAVAYNETNPDWQKLTAKFNKPGGLSLLFFSPSGNLVHEFNGSTSLSSTYLEQISIAQKNMNDEKAMMVLEKSYASGNRNTEMLKKLIVFRKNTNRDFGPVLDDYTRSIPPDSLKNITTIQYILSNAPLLNSFSDSMVKSDKNLFYKTWYMMDLRTRVNINNQVINKSIRKAVAEKNNGYADSIASFASNSNNSNLERLKAYNLVLSGYYRSINDTAGYFRYATVLYDDYYMKISVDSVETSDSLNRAQLFSKDPQTELQSVNKNSIQYQRSISYTSSTQFYAADLNRGAYSFYTMKANGDLTRKALQWGARSLEFFQTPQNLDTYARLLYKTGKRDSAVYYQQKAVDLQVKNKFPAGDYETTLIKMQKGEAKIDEYCCDVTTK